MLHSIMIGIVDFASATSVLRGIEKACASNIRGVEIQMLGPRLLNEPIGKRTYAEYENSFSSVSLDEIENLIRDVTTNVLFLVPGVVYDMYFNDLEHKFQHPNFEVVEERDVVLFGSHELQIRFHKIKHYAAVILRNRGERVSRSSIMANVGNKSHDITFTTDNWNIIFGWIYVAKQNNVKVPSVNTYMELCLEDKFKKCATIKHVMETINTSLSNNTNHLVILPDEMYAVYESSIQIVPANVTIVSESFLSFDLTQHVLVPKHRVTDAKELSQILAQYNGAESFPVMCVNDPVAKWFGFTEGQIIRVDRNNCDVRDTYYRRVVRP